MASTLSLMPVPQGLPSSSSLHTRHWPPIRLLTWTTENLDPTIQDGCLRLRHHTPSRNNTLLVVWWNGQLRRWCQNLPRATQSDKWLQSGSGQAWATSVDTRVEHGGWHRVPTVKLEQPRRLQRNRWQQPSSSQTCNSKGRWQRFSKQREMRLRNRFKMPRRPQRQPGVVDTRVIGSPVRRRTDETCRSVVQTDIIPQPTTSEDSSTLRLNITLSTQMCYTLVMMKTLYRCHNAGVNEVFARMEAVREGMGANDFVGLLMNLFSCRH